MALSTKHIPSQGLLPVIPPLKASPLSTQWYVGKPAGSPNKLLMCRFCHFYSGNTITVAIFKIKRVVTKYRA